MLSETSESLVVMTIDESTVTIIDEDFTAFGTLNDSNFTVNLPSQTVTDGGLTCQFNIVYNGSLISETTVEGTIDGSAICDGVSFPITGIFAANS